ncbi:MAG: ATP-dependent metalloprotease, partial [Gammaproteobacteria bacterium]
LSERLGPMTYDEEEGEVFLGHSVAQHKNVSDETAHIIDEEIRSIIDRNYKRAEQILTDNIDKLHAMSEALMKYETIDENQINDIMEGKPVREPDGWDDQTPSGGAGSSSDTEKTTKDKGEGKIGGPAGEH